ncbi:FadR/GntR family transcriptional regulator [Aquibacillus albus]|uniref:GntR family transcriptional repressor for pyruvate dehydrogenase complex n=1 Tax=Aquibacillus albus TaxID=1168171 RepID=A0ABS2MW14_9BACI|nr:FadR/GntR family transcriptional regulator [Aquibacillus albus]MBM7570040.1 GntR family transcriptional repressor for pyruvate dehydrogenase complex [Aquibacillus albus]
MASEINGYFSGKTGHTGLLKNLITQGETTMIVVSETVQKFLLDYIRKKGLQAGDKLPSERDLVQLLEVGRSSIREALQILAERGIIEKRAGKGAYLKTTLHHNELKDITTWLPSMDVNQSLDLLEFRKGIEVKIAYLAAKRRDIDCIDRLEKSMDDLRICVANGTSIIVPDLDFHGTLALATQNDVIVSVYKSVVDNFKKVRMEMAINDDIEHAFYYHKEILKAVKEKDSEKSGMLMQRHLEDVQLNYRIMLSELGGTP